MKPRLIIGTLGALSLAGVLAGPALADTPSPTSAPAHEARRCPDGFDAGDAAGVRICRDGDDNLRLETTDPARSGGHQYTGTLTTDGKFGDVRLVRPENDDSATLDGDGKLVYDFKTFGGVDGVAFHVGDGATSVTFNLFVDGQQLPAARVWIGDRGRHPEGDPFTLHVR